MKLTKEQRKLLKIFKGEYLTSGDICHKYHKDNISPNLTATGRKLKYSMKRNSQISSWLSKLEDKGLVRRSGFLKDEEFHQWTISNKGKELLKEIQNENDKTRSN